MTTKRGTSSDGFLSPTKFSSEVDSDQNITNGDLGFGCGLKPGAVALPMQPGGTDSTTVERAHLRRILSLGLGVGVGEEHDTCFGESLQCSVSRARKHSAPQLNTGCGDGHGMLTSPDLDYRDVLAKMESSTKEIVVLQSELEASRRHLDSKYRAIKILQSQSLMINKEQTRSILESGHIKKSLEQEVNALQFDLYASEECAKFKQHAWKDTFERLCMENGALVSTLQARSELVKRVQLENIALMRERDELLAMMDAKERLQYDRHKTPTNDSYLHQSMAQELAILGACLCRGSKPEPCQCARQAAKHKKENDLLKDEVDQLQQNLEATKLMADSFRSAFETQLDQNHSLSLQIAKVCSEAKNSSTKNKSVRRRKQVSDRNGVMETYPHQRTSICDDISQLLKGSKNRSVDTQVSEPLPDLIRTLADLLHDKTEALAHQRLMTKLLAQKTQDLEKTMQQLNEYSKQ